MEPKKSFAYHLIDKFMLFATNEQSPTPAEWNTYCAEYSSRPGGILGILVYTNGGHPTAVQRKQLRDALGDKPPKIAVLTQSTIIRAVTTALNLFISGSAQMFSPAEQQAALDYIGAPAALRAQLLSEMDKLKREIGISR